MEITEQETVKKAVEVMENVFSFMNDNKSDPKEAWEAVRQASNLTEDEMVQCAIVAGTCKE